MAYDSYNDKLSLTASKSGLNPGGSNIQITDTDGFLNQVLNVTQTGEIKGKNAILNINGVDTQKTENTFTQSGVSFTLAGAGSSTITVSTDASTVKNQIQKFVDNYNTLLANMNTKLTEEKATTGDKYTNYKPLSDDQKSAMSQTQIDAWNVQAQLGILQNDDTLQQAVTDMRMSLGRVVQTPLTITGTALSGTVDLTGGSHFSMTVGSQTREIYLDANSYSSTDYGSLVSDVQNKLDMAFGTGDVKVALDDKNQLTYTSQNIAMTVNNGAQNNGLESLGFTNGATVSHTYDRLSDIGITPSDNYLDNGKLTFDSDAFAAAIANDPNGVMRLLTNDQPASFTPTDTPILIAQKQDQENASKGIFYSFNEKLMGIPMISNEGTVNGIKGGLIHLFTNKAGLTGTGASDNELGKQILELNTQISDAQRRYNDQVDHLNSVFTHMETVIQKYNTQSAWLTAQLGGAPAASSGGNGGNQ
jgi:flagellar capping protein FliD